MDVGTVRTRISSTRLDSRRRLQKRHSGTVVLCWFDLCLEKRQLQSLGPVRCRRVLLRHLVFSLLWRLDPCLRRILAGLMCCTLLSRCHQLLGPLPSESHEGVHLLSRLPRRLLR